MSLLEALPTKLPPMKQNLGNYTDVIFCNIDGLSETA